MLNAIFKKSTILVLLFSVSISPIIASVKPVENNSQEDSGIGVGLFALGAGIIGGLGLSALFSSKSDTQIIDGSVAALAVSRGYDEQIDILDDALDLTKLLKDSKSKVIVKTLDEEINYDLASNGISIDELYTYELKKLIDDLQFYQNKLPKRIKKLNYNLKRKKDCDKNLEMISKMEELLQSINKVLPKLEFLRNYVKDRSGYFEFYNIITLKSEVYSSEISSLEKHTEDTLGGKLTRSARARYSESSLYPCIDYVKTVDYDIYTIQKYLKRLPKDYQDLHEDAQNLVDYLTRIRRAVVSDPDYSKEKRDLYDAEHPKTFLGLTYIIS